jgi:hypothetical protein
VTVKVNVDRPEGYRRLRFPEFLHHTVYRPIHLRLECVVTGLLAGRSGVRIPIGAGDFTKTSRPADKVAGV